MENKTSENKHDLNFYWYLLVQEEQMHANGFHFVEDRNRYIIARAILKKIDIQLY